MENSLNDRAWKISIIFGKLAGLWPGQSRFKNYTIRSLHGSSVFLLFFGFATSLVQQWNNDLQIVIENVVEVILMNGLLGALLTVCANGEKILEIIEKISMQREVIIDESEIEILRNTYDDGMSVYARGLALVGSSGALFVGLPFLKMYYLYIFSDGVLQKKLPIYVSYLVNEQEHFFHILSVLFMGVVSMVIVYLAIGLNILLNVRHTCGLFDIVNFRLKRASEVIEQCHEQGKELSELDEDNAYQFIISAVNLHNEAVELSQNIDDAYNGCFFYVLLLNATAIAPVPAIVMLNLHDPFETVRYSLGLVLFTVNFYLMFSQGQAIIDYSTSIFDSCYDFCWYSAPNRFRVAILIMMSNSLKPCQLTGSNMFELSMETYSVMLKTAISYISVVSALFL